MTALEKTFYGLLLTLATTFGGLIYHSAITRVAALEVQTREIESESKRQVIADQVSLAEVKTDLRYMRQSMDRIERKLDLLPLLPVALRPLPPAQTFQGR